MKEFKLPTESLIGGGYIESSLCDKIIDVYDKNQNIAQEGMVKVHQEDKIDKEVKDSFDIRIPIDLMISPFREYIEALQEVLKSYISKYDQLNNMYRFNITEPYNIQKYPIGGHFKKWHFERHSVTGASGRRLLVFMTYLCDVKEGGETEFLYQKIKVKPQKGLTLIWPADWTHTHRGLPCVKEEKYIVTGWYSFVD